jgi:hypothetical protein
MRKICLGFAFVVPFVSGFAHAQAPDIKVKGDLTLGLIYQSDRSLSFRAVSPLGRYSTLGVQALLPVGLNVFVSQRFARLPNDPDSDSFDEYYIEDLGSWRVGKQYLPFGGGFLFRESVRSARVDTSLLIEGIPMMIAVVESGAGKQFGGVVRVGSKGFGISVANGRRWGINGTALSVIRNIGDNNGAGWKSAFGVDWNRRFGKLSARIETIGLSGPEESGSNLNAFDAQFTYDLGKRHSALVGVSNDLTNKIAWLRVGGTYNLAKGFGVEGLFRSSNGEFRDFSVMLRIKF